MQGSQLVTNYCASSISDTLGNLLFYSNGRTIWNKEHKVMMNGDSLAGDTTAIHSPLIVKKPNSNSIYYMFTTDGAMRKYNFGINNGLTYYIIDLRLDSGRGMVISKNNLLNPFVGERLAILKHKNGKDFWIMTHSDTGNLFYSYLLCENGLSTNAVISKQGRKYDNLTETRGDMLQVENTNYLVVMYTKKYNVIWKADIEIFLLDSNTGLLEYLKTITLNGVYVGWQLKIPAKGNFLYIGFGYLKRQFAISIANNDFNVVGSRIFDTVSQSYNFVSNKRSDFICASASNFNDFDRIKNINDSIPICNIKTNTDTFNFDKSLNAENYGYLPNFPPFYFEPLNFSYEQTYQHMPCVFKAYSCLDSCTFDWDFGDTTSHALNYSSIKYPAHVYRDSGTYTVRCIKHRYDTENDTMIKTIHIDFNPKPVLGNDTTLCGSKNLSITAPLVYDKYFWNTGDTSRSIAVTKSGTYVLKTYKFYPGNCKATEIAENADTIRIDILPLPSKVSQRRYYACTGNSVTISAENPGMQYRWNTGDTTRYLTTSTPGSYVVKISNQQCFLYDTIAVMNYNTMKPIITIENNILYSTPAVTYKWLSSHSLSENTWQSFTPRNNGYFKVQITDSNGCQATSDSVLFERVFTEISIYPNPSKSIFTIELPNTSKFNYNLELFDVSGRSLNLNYKITDGVTLVDLSHFSAATYFLSIQRSDGYRNVRKLVKL